MRFTELMGKEIINLYDGSRLGNFADADLVLDADEGRVAAIILPPRGGWRSLFGSRQELLIPWEAVRKVGNELVVVDMDPTYSRRQKD
ncbi:YlmC/YmxH family sporulation protein [Neomoorella thermoacetica]|uniref:PRC-barrel domain protein n=3 Tax=Neomoorella thermoacetica TaxID=1525 RepID=A0A1D7X9Z6_NEOTH|nr:YlmC/YmxH family sporulation protein [Moorella thermoacetica]AKX93824.1 PRC-barrel domain protein [Moorella thermoacetica]AKX96466.1 PRC-barrel domain protein [Moorella thermoacetica]AOQ23743.1 PRC-barrel domain protein [Moorella thermoacetica]APC08202.1 PRC-barrel domain protein [Moorella thermoacetica]OIQ12716.1 PRC-barrel domain protein [Moorella thermoacetica]